MKEQEEPKDFRKMEQDYEQLKMRYQILQEQQGMESESRYRYQTLVLLQSIATSIQELKETLRNGINALGSTLSKSSTDEDDEDEEEEDDEDDEEMGYAPKDQFKKLKK